MVKEKAIQKNTRFVSFKDFAYLVFNNYFCSE